jgi:hypothetical protein
MKLKRRRIVMKSGKNNMKKNKNKYPNITKSKPVITQVYKVPESKESRDFNIIIKDEIYDNMKYIVDKVNYEVSWLIRGDVEDKEDEVNITLTDIYIPYQECTSVTTTMDLEKDENFILEMLKGQFIGWGHSHVRMSTTPSGTDDETLLEHSKDTNFFLRIIMNKSGDFMVDGADTTGVIKEKNFTIYCNRLVKPVKEDYDNLIKDRVSYKVIPVTKPTYSNYYGGYGVIDTTNTKCPRCGSYDTDDWNCYFNCYTCYHTWDDTSKGKDDDYNTIWYNGCAYTQKEWDALMEEGV